MNEDIITAMQDSGLIYDLMEGFGCSIDEIQDIINLI